MQAITPLQALQEAKQIARKFGMFIIQKPTTTGIKYLLYRKGFPRSAYLGNRTDEQGLKTLVTKCAGGRA